jgi:small subunit ribosomal protein S20
MAITKGAKKAIRVSARKRVYNIRRKVALHDAVKTVQTHITQEDASKAQADIAQAYKAIDKAAKRGLIKKNTAARKKSRLMKRIAKIGK